MTRQALRQTARKRVTQIQTLPAPIGGWNARDALATMPITDAIVLDNFFPDTNEVRLRKGFETHVTTGIGSTDVETLAEFNAGTTRKLLAAQMAMSMMFPPQQPHRWLPGLVRTAGKPPITSAISGFSTGQTRHKNMTAPHLAPQVLPAQPSPHSFRATPSRTVSGWLRRILTVPGIPLSMA